MKWFLRISLLFLSVIFLLLLFVYAWLKSEVPDNHGVIQNQLVKDSCTVVFDESGIPHIYAQHSEDAYKVLGYLHYRDRMFQMELLRRAGMGELSAFFGEDLVEADVMFHTMGLPEYCRESAINLLSRGNSQVLSEVNAYLRGINQAMNELPRCPEFKILGFTPEPFEIHDIYAVTGYMAFSFALGQRTDPLATQIASLGSEYLEDMALLHYDREPLAECKYSTSTSSEGIGIGSSGITTAMEQLQKVLPLPGFDGSNSWAVSGSKTQSGLPILCNDTHMKHGMPSTWYEAHLEAPDLSLYGNFIPGFPYCLVGHSRNHAWGLTMLEHDDMDFYYETLSQNGLNSIEFIPQDDGVTKTSSNKKNVLEIPLKRRLVNIAIRDKKDTAFTIIETSRGPLVNGIFSDEPLRPISMWWDFTRHENMLLEASRGMNRAADIKEFEIAVAQIHGPGLNVQYADKMGHIAWYAAAKLLRRPEGVNSMLIQDGSNTRLHPMGYYDFSDNPKSVDPSCGFIFSANEQIPPLSDGSIYPGYYKPHYRSMRIEELLSSKNNWDAESMKALITDIGSPADADNLREMLKNIEGRKFSDSMNQLITRLRRWDGRHGLENIEPVVYYKWAYHLLRLAMVDEIGTEDFEAFLGTHWFRRALPEMLRDEDSPWWNDVTTSEKEVKEDIFEQSFRQAYSELEAQLGSETAFWQWGQVRQLMAEHPLGKIWPLGLIFNCGPRIVAGADETINHSGFRFSGDGFYEITGGSQMRIVHDLNYPENSWSILPGGQSGNPFSPYYADQFEDYCSNRFRVRGMPSKPLKNKTNTVYFVP
jgi:penicillin amidase